jgi:hypothetical protein
MLDTQAVISNHSMHHINVKTKQKCKLSTKPTLLFMVHPKFEAISMDLAPQINYIMV